MIYMTGLGRPGRAAVDRYKKSWPRSAETWPPAPFPWRLVRGREHDAYRDPLDAALGGHQNRALRRRGEASVCFVVAGLLSWLS